MADSTPESPTISWDVARRVAARTLKTVASPERLNLEDLQEEFAELTAHAEELVRAATGLQSSAGPAQAVVTDRAGWAAANITSFERLLTPLADKLAARRRSLLATPTAAAAAGAEVGLVLAWISSRILGQYDLFPDESLPGGDAIYFVAPNIVSLERRFAFPPKEFRLWIAIHEVTHRMQFTGVPWMRGYFLDLVERGTTLTPPDAKAVLSSLTRTLEALRSGHNPLEDGGVVSLLATSDQLATLREAQALMSLLEGHGNAVMSTAGGEEIPGAKRFAKVLAERRGRAKGVTKLVQQALGLEAKLRQYEEGQRFVDAVVAEGGAALFGRIWSGPELLPTIEEIRKPSDWIARAGTTSRAG